jgi:hypothetical protein
MWIIEPKTNAVISLHMGDTRRGYWAQEDREREGNQKLECG